MYKYLLTIPMLLMWSWASADVFESLFSPGDLVKSHAKYQQQCNRCHVKGRKTEQTRLCRQCHKEINKDMLRKKGYHGRSKQIRSGSCRGCHTEHKGKKAQIVHLDKDIFNHNLTDFPLKGRHRGAGCGECHKAGKKWRQASGACYDCHKKKDVHKGKLGKNCQNCHGGHGWGKSQFDHNKTKFPLKGKHRQAGCEGCHPNNRFKKTPKRCYDCHSVDDVHRGLFDRKCGRCHMEQKWKKLRFNHNRHTKFSLKGRHKKTSCGLCHKKNAYRYKLKKNCYACHRHDDVHKGKFGRDCKRCHQEKQWSSKKFNHDKTKFPLRGKHKEAACSDCHRGGLKRKISGDCYGCHKSDDVHKGKQGKKCARCHRVQGWRSKVIFDHDTTAFPLIGLHAVVPCEDCHQDRVYKNAKKACLSCHARNDVHKRSLGPDCTRCHNPNGWRVWRFNHDKQTDYPLEGKHKGLACRACHIKPVTRVVKLSTECADCHSTDDIHRGRFGQQCERCHSVAGFQQIKLH